MINNGEKVDSVENRNTEKTGWESVAAEAQKMAGEQKQDIRFEKLSPDDNFEQVGDLLYLVDQYIFPDLFGNEDGARKFAKELFSDDPNALFSYDKTLVAKDDEGSIVGILVYRGDKCTPWNTDAVREKFLATGNDLPENFERANEHYMKKVTDAELPKDAVEIEFLGVSEKARGKGIGGKLMELLYDNPSVSEAHLDVLDSHPNASRLYGKLGFLPEGDKFPNYPDGNEGVQHMVRKNSQYINNSEDKV